MDFDASPILYGGMSRNDMALNLAGHVAKTAGGTPTKSEVLGHKEFYIPYKYQEKAVAYKRACLDRKPLTDMSYETGER